MANPVAGILDPMRRILRGWYGARLGRLTILRLGLLVGGMTAAVTGIVAILSLAGTAEPLFADLGEVVEEPPALAAEAAAGRIPAKVIATAQPAMPDGDLCPELERQVSIDRLPGVPVHLLGLDLVGDPRVPIPDRVLDASAIRDLLEPTLILSPRVRDRYHLETGDTLWVRSGDATIRFRVSDARLPREFDSGPTHATAITDISWFASAISEGPGLDRLRILAHDSDRMSLLEAKLGHHLPPDMRLLAGGEGSMRAREWLRAWQGGSGLIVNAGYLVGVVIIFLTATATFARQLPRRRRLLAAGKGKVEPHLLGLGEVIAGSAIAVAIGAPLGRGLAAFALRIGFPSRPWMVEVPIDPGPIAWGATMIAVGAGAGLAAFWVDLGHEVPPERRHRAAPRVAAAGVLFVIASMLVFPGVHGYPAILGHLAVFLTMVAIALLGRPAFESGIRMLGRIGVKRESFTARVVTSQILESWTPFGVAMALLVFGFAVSGASWILIHDLSTRQADWRARAFPADVVVEAVASTDRHPGLLPFHFARAIEALPEVRGVSGVREVNVTMSGMLVPTSAVSREVIEGLPDLHPRPLPANRETAGAAPAGAGMEIAEIWFPRSMKNAAALRRGDPLRLDTPAGTWPGVVAGEYRPYPGQEPRAYVDAGRHLLHFAATPGWSRLRVRFGDGVDPVVGRRAISRAVSGERLRMRDLTPVRRQVGIAADMARRMLVSQLLVLSILVVLAAVTTGPSIVLDAPASWLVFMALGVPPARIARSATIGLITVTGAMLGVGILTAALAATILVRTLSPPDGLIGFPALPGLWLILAGLSVWVITALVGAFCLRRGLVGGAIPIGELAR